MTTTSMAVVATTGAARCSAHAEIRFMGPSWANSGRVVPRTARYSSRHTAAGL